MDDDGIKECKSGGGHLQMSSANDDIVARVGISNFNLTFSGMAHYLDRPSTDEAFAIQREEPTMTKQLTPLPPKMPLGRVRYKNTPQWEAEKGVCWPNSMPTISYRDPLQESNRVGSMRVYMS